MSQDEIRELKFKIKNLEVKIKILELLLSRTIPNYAEEILKVYWSLGEQP